MSGAQSISTRRAYGVPGYVSFCVQKRLRKTSGHGKG